MWEYEGSLIRVIDGDTVVLRVFKTFSLNVDFGFYVKDRMSLEKSAEISFRLYGINTPELKGETYEAAKLAKAELQRLLEGKPLKVISYKTDKYGRWLADIYVKDEAGVEKNVNQLLVEGGFAVPYMV